MTEEQKGNFEINPDTFWESAASAKHGTKDNREYAPNSVRRRVGMGKNVWEAALDRMRFIYANFEEVVVSFSGGKDSTATMMVAYEVAKELNRLPLRVIFIDEEAIPYQTEEYVRRVSQLPGIQLDWYCLPIRHRNACSRENPWWFPWAREDEAKWVRPLPPEANARIDEQPVLKEWMEKAHADPELRVMYPEINDIMADPAGTGKKTIVLIGLRAQESIRRMRLVSKRPGSKANYIVTDGIDKHGAKLHSQKYTPRIFKGYPVYDWTTNDIWTAVRKFDWDYNQLYRHMVMAKIPVNKVRVGPPYGEEPMISLWMFSKVSPEVWDKMAHRVPGANTGAMYAHTELWGIGIPPKPGDLTWEEYMVHYIKKFRPEDQKVIAKRIRRWLGWHHGKTNDPILPNSPHPLTGISWGFLMSVAMRGDFKNRKEPPAPRTTERERAMVENYKIEYRMLAESGELLGWRVKRG